MLNVMAVPHIRPSRNEGPLKTSFTPKRWSQPGTNSWRAFLNGRQYGQWRMWSEVDCLPTTRSPVGNATDGAGHRHRPGCRQHRQADHLRQRRQSVAVQQLCAHCFRVMRLEIKARANDIAAQTTGISNAQDVRATRSASRSAQDERQAESAANSYRTKQTKPLAAKIAQLSERRISLATMTGDRCAALIQRVTSGQAQIDAAVESIDLSKANTGLGPSLVGFTCEPSTTMPWVSARKIAEWADSARSICRGGASTSPSAGGNLSRWSFSHNGSVPTIYQLLGPAPRHDLLGRVRFDRGLGLSTRPCPRRLLARHPRDGNSNIGHEFRRGYIPWKSAVRRSTA